MILEEFDKNKKALINPSDMFEKLETMPKVAVSCFSVSRFELMIETLNAEKLTYLESANGKIPVYSANYNGVQLALYMSRVGAAGCVGNIEEIIAQGAEKIIIFGSCGVLDKTIKDQTIIIPNCAVRDEGTSYHYEESSDEIAVNIKYKDLFKSLLTTCGVDYTEGKVWTTDAFYRETEAKFKRRKEAGCICVDMECSAVSAVAKFREIDVFQFFYAADNLDAEKWDRRSLSSDCAIEDKDAIAFLALEMARSMHIDD